MSETDGKRLSADSIEILVKGGLDTLAEEHSEETFITDGYSYYERATELFVNLITNSIKGEVDLVTTAERARIRAAVEGLGQWGDLAGENARVELSKVLAIIDSKPTKGGQ